MKTATPMERVTSTENEDAALFIDMVLQMHDNTAADPGMLMRTEGGTAPGSPEAHGDSERHSVTSTHRISSVAKGRHSRATVNFHSIADLIKPHVVRADNSGKRSVWKRGVSA